MNTHFAVCDAFASTINANLHCEGGINFKQVLCNVSKEGYFPGENLEVFSDRLIFHLDDGTNITLYLYTLH